MASKRSRDDGTRTSHKSKRTRTSKHARPTKTPIVDPVTEDEDTDQEMSDPDLTIELEEEHVPDDNDEDTSEDEEEDGSGSEHSGTSGCESEDDEDLELDEEEDEDDDDELQLGNMSHQPFFRDNKNVKGFGGHTTRSTDKRKGKKPQVDTKTNGKKAVDKKTVEKKVDKKVKGRSTKTKTTKSRPSASSSAGPSSQPLTKKKLPPGRAKKTPTPPEWLHPTIMQDFEGTPPFDNPTRAVIMKWHLRYASLHRRQIGTEERKALMEFLRQIIKDEDADGWKTFTNQVKSYAGNLKMAIRQQFIAAAKHYLRLPAGKKFVSEIQESSAVKMASLSSDPILISSARIDDEFLKGSNQMLADIWAPILDVIPDRYVVDVPSDLRRLLREATLFTLPRAITAHYLKELELITPNRYTSILTEALDRSSVLSRPPTLPPALKPGVWSSKIRRVKTYGKILPNPYHTTREKIDTKLLIEESTTEHQRLQLENRPKLPPAATSSDFLERISWVEKELDISNSILENKIAEIQTEIQLNRTKAAAVVAEIHRRHALEQTLIERHNISLDRYREIVENGVELLEEEAFKQRQRRSQGEFSPDEVPLVDQIAGFEIGIVYLTKHLPTTDGSTANEAWGRSSMQNHPPTPPQPHRSESTRASSRGDSDSAGEMGTRTLVPATCPLSRTPPPQYGPKASGEEDSQASFVPSTYAGPQATMHDYAQESQGSTHCTSFDESDRPLGSFTESEGGTICPQDLLYGINK